MKKVLVCEVSSQYEVTVGDFVEMWEHNLQNANLFARTPKGNLFVDDSVTMRVMLPVEHVVNSKGDDIFIAIGPSLRAILEAPIQAKFEDAARKHERNNFHLQSEIGALRNRIRSFNEASLWNRIVMALSRRGI
jgi:hypothetical protein